ncbi:hypothetical protein [Pseudarthrobacter sp. YALA5]|uniref:hypothetical protein n=1 Tax=Pseudarthrobacter sp. DSP2-3-2b1 TaxID=2804661 RepID=UPI00103ACF68
MSENHIESTRDVGPHQHAHAQPTTQQIRTVGQRRREAEEKLEHHLEEARHKSEHHDEHHGGATAEPNREAAAGKAKQPQDGSAP